MSKLPAGERKISAGKETIGKKAYIKVSETIAIRVERVVVKIKKVGSDSIDVAHGTYEDVLDVELGWVDDLKCRE